MRRKDVLVASSDVTPTVCRCQLDSLDGTLEVSLGRDEVWITPVQQQDGAEVEGE